MASKNSSNNISDMNDFLNHLVDQLRIGEDLKVFSEDILKRFEEMFKDIKIENKNQLTSSEMKKVFDRLSSELKVSGMSTTASNAALAEFKKRIEGIDLPLDKLITQLTNLSAEMERRSNQARESGKGTEFFKATNSSLGKVMTEGTAKGMGIAFQQGWDKASKKLFGFLEPWFVKNVKSLKTLGEDLVEGLANSKFIGGAMKDIFSLVGLMGGRWLSQFGTLGKVLGVTFYGAMSAFGPVLSKIILEATLKATLQGVGQLIKFLGVGRSFGIAAGVVGSLWAAGEARDSWRRGRKGNAVAFGLGSAGMGLGAGALALGSAAGAVGTAAAGTSLGATAASIAAMLGPIGWTLLGIGAGIAVLAGIWKKFGKDIKAWGKQVTESVVSGFGSFWNNTKDALSNWGKKATTFFTRAFEFMSMFNPVFAAIKWIRDHWPFGGNDGGGSGGSGGSRTPRGKVAPGAATDLDVVERIDNMSLNKSGAILDVSKMDKMTASRVAEQYRQQRPTEFNRTYELAGNKYANLADFQNDWAIRNAQGQATQAVLYKGASQTLENMWTALVSTGAMTEERAQLLKYTSGRSTATSPHSRKGTNYFNSHDNILNLVTDLGAASWTDDEWEAAMKVLKPMLYDAGFDLKWEGINKQGKTIFGDQFVRGLTNRHFHVGIRKGFEHLIPDEAQENIKELDKRKEATITSDTMAISNVLKSLPEDERKRIADKIQKEKLTGKSPDEFVQNAEKVLREEGIYRSDSLKGRPWVKKGENGEDQFLMDAAGNRTYSKMQQTISNYVNIGTENTAYS